MDNDRWKTPRKNITAWNFSSSTRDDARISGLKAVFSLTKVNADESRMEIFV